MTRSSVLRRLILALALCVACGTLDRAVANDAPVEHDAKPTWLFRADFYSWLTTQHGTVTQRGRTVVVDVDLHDVFDLLGNGDAIGGAGHVEAHHVPSRVTLFADAAGTVVDTAAKNSQGRATLDSSLAFVEWALGYRIWQATFGDEDERAMWLEPIVGGRYTYSSNTIGITPTGRRTVTAESSIDFVDPFVGGRWLLELPYGFGLSWRADIGGFGAGSQLSWSMVTTASYTLPWQIAGAPLLVGAGYKIISFDYEDGTGDARRDIDLEFRGPLLGFGTRF